MRCRFWIPCTSCTVMGNWRCNLGDRQSSPSAAQHGLVWQPCESWFVCVQSLVSVVAFCLVGCESHAARMMVHGVGQSSDENSTSRDTRKCVQLLSDACTATLPGTGQLLRMRTFQAGSEAVVRMARMMAGC